jgi:hypothetical protein
MKHTDIEAEAGPCANAGVTKGVRHKTAQDAMAAKNGRNLVTAGMLG